MAPRVGAAVAAAAWLLSQPGAAAPGPIVAAEALLKHGECGKQDALVAQVDCLFRETYGGKQPREDAPSAYGELLPSGVEALLQSWTIGSSLAEDDVFFDLGAGTGRAATQIFLTTPVGRAVGFEVSSEQFSQGREALAGLQRVGVEAKQQASLDSETTRATFTLEKRDLTLEQGDLLSAQLREATTVLVNNAAFSAELTESVVQLLLSTVVPGTIVVLASELGGCPRGLMLLNKMDVDVTSGTLDLFVYMATTPAEDAELIAGDASVMKKVPEGRWGGKPTQLRRLRKIVSESKEQMAYHRDRGLQRSAVQCDAVNLMAASENGGKDGAAAFMAGIDLTRKDEQTYDVLRHLIEAQAAAAKSKKGKEKGERIMTLVSQVVQAIAAIRFPKRNKGKKAEL